MAEGVISVDFGIEQREAARKFSHLLGLVAQREEDMLKDPKKYFDMAAKEISRLRLLLQAMQDAGAIKFSAFMDEPTFQPGGDHMYVLRSDYDRWKEIDGLLTRWRDWNPGDGSGAEGP